MRIGPLVVCLGLGVLGLFWLDWNVEWIHNLTPRGKREQEAIRVRRESTQAFYDQIAHTLQRHLVVVPGFDDDDGGGCIEAEVRLLLETPKGIFINVPSDPSDPGKQYRSIIGVYQVKGKYVKTSEEQQLLVSSAQQRLEFRIHELSGNSTLSQKERDELYGLREARGNAVLMQGKGGFLSPGQSFSTTAYVPVSYPFPYSQ